ncbi:MAG: hypothetical protein EOP84_21110 [Verrucomicrobiaceae bacterium]|nr:MAG: hypothetical protein EOP84_21110 [Verrucomicrobiaceae bacterium]
MHILQVNFRVSISREAYEEECAPVAQVIAEVPGLVWNAWMFNEEASTAGGIYLFENEDALEDFLESSIVQGLKRSPAFSEMSVNRFELMPELSAITRFPLGEPTPAVAEIAPEHPTSGGREEAGESNP